jgi:outer membrane protein TolC
MKLPAGRSATLTVVALLGCASSHDTTSASAREPIRNAGPSAGQPRADERSPQNLDARVLESAELEHYLAFGLANSADLRAAEEHWRAALERVEQASALPDPRFSYGEFLEEVQTRTGPQERRFGVSQAFPWPGRLDAQADLAEHQAEASWQRVLARRLEVGAAIEVAFHEYAYLGRERSITVQRIELLHGLEPVVQSRVRAGAGQEDLLRLQVEIGRLEDDLAGIERRRPVLSARLAHAMNLTEVPGGGMLPVPELTEPSTRSVEVEALHGRARERNPHLGELSRELDVRRQAEELAEYARTPSFNVGLDYIQTGDAVAPATSGSGDDPILVRVSVSLPIWPSSYAAGEREARHLFRASRERRDAAESALRANVEEEAYRVDEAARRIGLYRDSLIPRASESLALTMASYRTGTATVLDLIDSERALLEFELSFWRSCREYRQGDARLRALLGGDEQ